LIIGLSPSCGVRQCAKVFWFFFSKKNVFLDLSGAMPYITHMPTSANHKSARLDTRITPELQEQLRRIADIQGRSVSDYVTTALQSAVQRDSVEIEAVRLSREASERFAAALIDPPELNAAMRRAFAHHRSLIGSA